MNSRLSFSSDSMFECEIPDLPARNVNSISSTSTISSLASSLSSSSTSSLPLLVVFNNRYATIRFDEQNQILCYQQFDSLDRAIRKRDSMRYEISQSTYIASNAEMVIPFIDIDEMMVDFSNTIVLYMNDGHKYKLVLPSNHDMQQFKAKLLANRKYRRMVSMKGFLQPMYCYKFEPTTATNMMISSIDHVANGNVSSIGQQQVETDFEVEILKRCVESGQFEDDELLIEMQIQQMSASSCSSIARHHQSKTSLLEQCQSKRPNRSMASKIKTKLQQQLQIAKYKTYSTNQLNINDDNFSHNGKVDYHKSNLVRSISFVSLKVD